MTTSLPHTHLRLRDLSELVAGIPYIIGFPPTDSLVLFTFRRCPELGLSSTIRVDLPLPDHVVLVAEEMAEAVARNEGAAVIAVVIAENGPEHRELIDMLRKTLEDKNILLTHSSWVPKVAHGEEWRCYDDPLCAHVVPDPQTSALAAATAVAGDTTYPNREAMAAHFSPDPEEMLAYRKRLLNAYRMSSPQSYTNEELQADMEILGHAMDKAANSYELPTLTDHQMVRLGRALTRGEVKDECLAMALSDEPEAAERLWTVLIRGLPAPERAEPAFLLAMSAYLRGAGVVAALALKVVMESNPLHKVAVLLDYALQRGVPPDHVRDMLLASVLKSNEEQKDPADTADDSPGDATPGPSNTSPTSSGEPAEQRDPEPSEAGDGVLTTTRSNNAPAPPVPPVDPPANEETPGGQEPPNPSAIRSVPSTVTMGAPPGSTPFRAKPGPLGRRIPLVLGASDGAPVRRTVPMDALTAFLPPPTDQRGPG